MARSRVGCIAAAVTVKVVLFEPPIAIAREVPVQATDGFSINAVTSGAKATLPATDVWTVYIVTPDENDDVSDTVGAISANGDVCLTPSETQLDVAGTAIIVVAPANTEDDVDASTGSDA
jgi:hypothetical protein